MHWILGILLTLFTFCLMEIITWLTHRYVMHGFLWFLHKDHHQTTPGALEKNDWFAVIFAVPCIILFERGNSTDTPWLSYVAAGILLYGVAYFLVHDIIIHQRIKWLRNSKNSYIRAMRWGHKMHHKHLNADPGESFGFLWVEKKYRNKIKADDERNRSQQK